MDSLRPNPDLLHLECSRCQETCGADRLINLCPCGGPLLVRYLHLGPVGIDNEAPGLWRYHRLLPLDARDAYLGEGATPLLRAPRLAAELGVSMLLIKDESRNPTGSFKDRGMAVAVPMASRLGARGVVAPSAGNAGAAMAVYAARLGLPAVAVMPADTPSSTIRTVRAAGAEVELVDALIDGAGRRAQEIARQRGFFNLATLAEPYRVEGKKTMGLELVEQLGGVPDVIVYPLGGGTGIVGMDKAFAELEHQGRIDGRRPSLVAVQSEGCAPVVRAFEVGDDSVVPWEGAQSCAPGLRVPRLLADVLVLRALRRSGGAAVAVEDQASQHWMQRAAALEGILMGPESACALAGLASLLERGHIGRDERVVLFHTGAPYGSQGRAGAVEAAARAAASDQPALG